MSMKCIGKWGFYLSILVVVASCGNPAPSPSNSASPSAQPFHLNYQLGTAYDGKILQVKVGEGLRVDLASATSSDPAVISLVKDQSSTTYNVFKAEKVGVSDIRAPYLADCKKSSNPKCVASGVFNLIIVVLGNKQHFDFAISDRDSTLPGTLSPGQSILVVLGVIADDGGWSVATSSDNKILSPGKEKLTTGKDYSLAGFKAGITGKATLSAARGSDNWSVEVSVA